jgi:hypothetical protein
MLRVRDFIVEHGFRGRDIWMRRTVDTRLSTKARGSCATTLEGPSFARP